MQLAVIEYARNVLNIKDADTTEINPKTTNPVIDIIEGKSKLLKAGSLRIGSIKNLVVKGTKTEKIYGSNEIFERHRHKYEFTTLTHKKHFDESDLKIAGLDTKEQLISIIEIKNHPFFIATQFYPELISRPTKPHPLFVSFVKVAK